MGFESSPPWFFYQLNFMNLCASFKQLCATAFPDYTTKDTKKTQKTPKKKAK
jgi:hypothetical protein